ncbi:DNA primase family protein [Maricaulis sp.]|uniref:DNA primase family protein n=1 Tax=Maricaulis sp. TaxID=1486257 RepID=UPI003A8E356D
MSRDPKADPAVKFHNVAPFRKPLQNDSGNADRFARQHKGKAFYCRPLGGWLVWDGRRFTASDADAVAIALAKETARSIYDEAKTASRDTEKGFANFAVQSGNLPRLKAMLSVAISCPDMCASHTEFDADKAVLNVNNGILDLRTGATTRHDPNRRMSKLAPVNYDAAAECPTWLTFLDRIFEGDQELIDFLQVAAGYSLTGDTGAQVFFIAHGAGANGKSTFLNAMREILGDYAIQTPADTLMQKSSINGGSASPDLARLPGARFVVAVEADTGRKLAEATIKQLTGGDQIAARRLHQDFFEFVPVCKIWLATNAKPEIGGTDEGIWRRVKMIPFNVTIPAEERDSKLPEKLRAEYPGILAWAVQGAMRWHDERRLPSCNAVEVATLQYRQDSDRLADFWTACCIADKSRSVKAGDLYAAYQRFCAESGDDLATKTKFGMLMKARLGISTRKSGGLTVYLGLRLKLNGAG